MKQPKWKLFLIILVISLTIYNILPTVFYYLKPLKSSFKNFQKVEKSIMTRVNSLQKDSIDWIQSFCKLLKIKGKITSFDDQLFVDFTNAEDARTFHKYLQRAGSLIPFAPSRLSSYIKEDSLKRVIIQREMSFTFDTKNPDKYFFSSFNFSKDQPTKFFKKITLDRAAYLGYLIFGPSKTSKEIEKVLKNPKKPLLLSLARKLDQYNSLEKPSRFFSFFTNGIKDKTKAINSLINIFSQARDKIRMEKKESTENLAFLEKEEILLMKAENILKKNKSVFTLEKPVKTYEDIYAQLSQDLIIKGFNPTIEKILINWKDKTISFIPYQDAPKQEIVDEIAYLKKETSEKIIPSPLEYTVHMNLLKNAQSFSAIKLRKVAEIETQKIKTILQEHWNPSHKELLQDVFPIYDYNTYKSLPKDKKALCIVVFAPILEKSYKKNSIYIVIKGLSKIFKKYQMHQDSSEKIFSQDIKNLQNLLYKNNYFFSELSEFPDALTFEKDNYFFPLIKASRENFHILGSKKYAFLEFSDLQQRILEENKIATAIHENLLKTKDEYNVAQSNPDTLYDVPKPTKNLLLSNLSLSFKKYFKGDNRKVLHWGLDLLGGKTVRLELKDQNNTTIKDPVAISQGVNELYRRVNRLGVSDVKIKTFDTNIVLDFPGAQNISAKDLIQASSMYFHVVNEKFSLNNPSLKDSVQQFLQEVWNEAIVEDKTDIHAINDIAREHLEKKESPYAKILQENGLKLAPFNAKASSSFDTSFSKIAIFRDKDFSKWQGQTSPLLIVFNNYALEGSSLNKIQASYDPTKGNYLSFQVKKGKGLLHQWTSNFSSDSTHQKGSRMAVILNDSIISAPVLEATLRDSAMISGSFTKREIQKLSSDLKAGSLSYTPRILSEKNITPEIGIKERKQGILATFLALILIILAIISYYRFYGVVAGIAVIFNLFIMWATLQNIQATLTLASIAGIILSIGMAVDANVLIFERIKEEFFLTQKLSSSILSGYKKAYSAILDSNVTTIIAAIILLHFDSGPIKGFAITLIIGIASSMFSSLFMTKYFFSKWIQKTKETQLKMSSLIKETNVDFLKKAKYICTFSFIILVLGITCCKKSILGMDFTGGYSLDLQIKKTSSPSMISQAFIKNGASIKDFQIKQLESPYHLRILLGTSMELKGKPFYNLPQFTNKTTSYPFENNPRISWVVHALNSQKIEVKDLSSLENNWTSMSSEMSDVMRNNAIIGLSIALLSIFLYITFRFEAKFAISAILCLIHDVLITLATISLFHAFGMPIQIDLHTVAALMTIVGYSLNDTIIIFDRIREDMKFMRKSSTYDIINHSLNSTISRTSITSLTTLLVLLVLAILGGTTIFGFTMVMILGVIYGTLSSLFIASPIMLFFQKKKRKTAFNKG